MKSSLHRGTLTGITSQCCRSSRSRISSVIISEGGSMAVSGSMFSLITWARGARVFIETSRKTRAFGNVCAPKNALIFKGQWPFYHHSHLLTSSQTPKESFREKATSVKKYKTYPYGVLPNLRPPLNRRVHLLRVANRRP